jgi:hypothetical protein
MLNLRICSKCPHGDYHKEYYDKDGLMKIKPSVSCGLLGDELLMNSELFDNCPYLLEHQISCQDVPIGFANSLSGCVTERTGRKR